MRNVLKRSLVLTYFVRALRQIPVDVQRLLWYLWRNGQVHRYLEEHQVRKLHIGAGPNMLDGWLNADFNPSTRQPGQIYLNATVRFPFADSTFDYVFSEHMIEHLWWQDAQAMLRECFRVLSPGGRIRIATPNLTNIVALMEPVRTPIKEQYIKAAIDRYIPFAVDNLPGFVVNNFFWDFGHYFVYDEHTLESALTRAGFSHVCRCEALESDDPELADIDSHQKVVGHEINSYESIIVEAVKV